MVALFAGAAAAAEATRWTFPFSAGAILLGLLALVAALVVLRRRLLAGRPMRETVTWDCGYAAPAARMQYTATGYAQPLVQGAGAILRTKNEIQSPQGVFPVAATFRSETPDVAQGSLFDPAFQWAAKGLGRLRWLQQGRVHLYILYIVVTLMVLLAWALES